MNTDVILDYLMELERNNNREFYHAHKKEYQAAKAEFEALIQELIFRIGKTDGSVLGCVPGELTFRLTRDTRFSHDKSPYNPAFRAHISGSGKLPVPVGYYLMIKPGGQSFLGGGSLRICSRRPRLWCGIILPRTHRSGKRWFRPRSSGRVSRCRGLR